MPTLSIIVPVYRAAAYLRRCVGSILQQTWNDYELILVDDEPGSRSAAICREYARADERVRVIVSGGCGVWEARRTGMAAAAGEFVGFVDSDDWIDDDHFERLLRAVHRWNSDVATSHAYLAHGRSARRRVQGIGPNSYRGDSLTSRVYPRMLSDRGSRLRAVLPALWLSVVRRDVLLVAASGVPPRLRHAEDVVVTYLSLLRSESLVVVAGGPTYHYRIRRRSIMASHKADYLGQCLSVCRALERESRRIGRYDIGPQIATNLVYFTVHSIFNDSLGGLGPSARSWRLRAACRNPDVRHALQSYNPRNLPLAYRLLASLLVRNRFAVASAIAEAYPVAVRIIGEIV